MSLRYLPAACFAALSLAGCGQSTQETAVEGEAESNAPIAVSCPTANESGIIEIQPGLTAKVLNKGYGRVAVTGDYVGVHADLWLFDESQPANKGLEVWSSGGVDPFEFQIGFGNFIEGWSPGIECMHLGETRELTIAPELAYGARGRPPVPPNATLLYELELVRVQGPQETVEPVTE